jgi:hypothetical protein
VPGAKPGGVIQAWGLFPASYLQATVLLAASGSPSGWGTCTLSELELAALWDVPILVLDSLSGGEAYGILWGFCTSAPGKVLFARTDALLTTSFRGDRLGLLTLCPGHNPNQTRRWAWHSRRWVRHWELLRKFGVSTHW